MLAALGATILSASILGFGVSYNSHLSSQAKSLKELLGLLQTISTRIECFHSPLHEIYRDFSSAHLDKIGFTDDLKKNGLAFALIRSRSRLSLRASTFNSLSELASCLGKSYADDQIKTCNRYEEILRTDLARVEKELPNKMKLSLCLSAAGALMIAILFL